MVKYSHIPLEVLVLIFTLLLTGINFILPDWILIFSPYLLLTGIVFPGIPHGAIDHYLEVNNNKEKYYLPLFIIKYISVMILVALFWFIFPLGGLTLFILYSAWHFGETDMRRVKSFHPLTAFLSGLGLLIFILSSHGAEFNYYINFFGINQFEDISTSAYLLVSIISISILLIIGIIKAKEKNRYFSLIIIVLLGSFLPLLLAFGIYFILIHSISGWTDIRKGLKVSNLRLLLRATPFSLGAFLIMGLFIIISNIDNSLLDKYISSFFIALASISAPHILYMSKFYKSNL
jgi:beta-carotene 15,15'-dioxygenase